MSANLESTRTLWGFTLQICNDCITMENLTQMSPFGGLRLQICKWEDEREACRKEAELQKGQAPWSFGPVLILS